MAAPCSSAPQSYVKWVKDKDGRIVYHDKWPKDTNERYGAGFEIDAFNGKKRSWGLQDGDVVYINGFAVWHEPPLELREPKFI